MTWPDYIGLDPGPARDLAITTGSWSSAIEDALAIIRDAEVLTGEPVQVSPTLERVAYDGREMSNAIARAVDEIESFRIPATSGWTPAMDGMIATTQATAPAASWNQLPGGPDSYDVGTYWNLVANEVPSNAWSGSATPPAPFVLDMTGVTKHIDNLVAQIEQMNGSYEAGVELDDHNYAFGELTAIGRQVTYQEAQQFGRSAGSWVHKDIAAVATDWGVDYDEGALLHRRQQILTQEPTVELHKELIGLATALTALHQTNRNLASSHEASEQDLNVAIAATEQRFATPVGGFSVVDIRARELEQVRTWWLQADRLELAAQTIPTSMPYAQSSVVDDATELRERAWAQIEGLNADPQTVISALVYGQVKVRDVARSLELDRAHRLVQAADGLAPSTLQLEGQAMRAEANDILQGLFLAQAGRAVVDRFGTRLDPFETALLAGYAMQSPDGGAAVLESADPVRVIQVMAQGYGETAAINFVEASAATGLGAMTFIELEAALVVFDANQNITRYEYDETLGELDRRSTQISGLDYGRAQLDAVRVAERHELGYADSMAAILSARIDAVTGSPAERERQLAGLEGDLVLLAQARNHEERQAQLEAGLEPRHGTGRPLEPVVAAEIDPHARASRLWAMVSAGASLGTAEALDRTLDRDISAAGAAQIYHQSDRLISSGIGVGDAVDAASVALEDSLSIEDIHDLAQDEGIDFPTAFTMTVEAHRRDMTIAEYHAYNGFRDEQLFAAFDGARGNIDGKVSLDDLSHVINTEDRFSAEEVAAATAFVSSPHLMVRLDTARDFNEGVIGDEGFGRNRPDDLLWSLDDIQAFEDKQNLNFVLGDRVDLIDSAAEGGATDSHLSKKDFQYIFDNADELGLTAREIQAVEIVINAELYDQHYFERNRDSLALAAAVAAGTSIFIVTGGTGGAVSAALIWQASLAAGTSAIAAAYTTMGINALTGEMLDDGVNDNALKGAYVGTVSGYGLLSSAAGLGAATTLGKASGLVGLTGELAGLTGLGALDWFFEDSFHDSIDAANRRASASKVNQLITGGTMVVGTAKIGIAAGALDTVTTQVDLTEAVDGMDVLKEGARVVHGGLGLSTPLVVPDS